MSKPAGFLFSFLTQLGSFLLSAFSQLGSLLFSFLTPLGSFLFSLLSPPGSFLLSFLSSPGRGHRRGAPLPAAGYFAFIIFILMLSGRAYANTEDPSGTDSGTMKQARQDLFITAEDVKQKIDLKASLALIDIRSPEEFTQAHIPGSLNIPIHFIRTKAFLKSSPVIIVTDGYQYARLEPECKRLTEQGFKVSILLGGLNYWKQASLPLGGESWAGKTFDSISPEAFYLEKDYDHWVVLDASGKEAGKEAMPFAVPFNPDSQFFATSRLKSTIEKHRKSEQCLVLITNDAGTDYQNIARIISKAELKNVFYLEGGIKAYEQYLKGMALSQEPREKRIQKIQKCPTCGG